MVVCHFGTFLCNFHCLFQGIKCKADCRHTHCRTVPPWVVGLGSVWAQPLWEHIAICSHRMRIFTSPFLHTSNKSLLGMQLVVQNPVCHSNGHDGIVSIVHPFIFKVYLGWFVRIKLIDASCNVTQHSPHEHRTIQIAWLFLSRIVFSCHIGIVDSFVPTAKRVRSLAPSPMTETVVKKSLHWDWHSIISAEVAKSFSYVTQSFIQ